MANKKMKREVQQRVQKHEDDKKKHRSHVNENRQEEKRKRVSKFRPPPTPPTAIPLSTAQTRGAVQRSAVYSCGRVKDTS